MLRPGDEIVPGYTLVKFLGRGQFGEVWKSTAPGKTFAAIKVIDLSGKQGWKEFQGIQHVKRIQHAHLMPITAIWLLDDAGNVLSDEAMDAIAASTSQPAALDETIRPSDTMDGQLQQPRWLVIGNLLGDRSLADLLATRIEETGTGIAINDLLRYMEEAAKGLDYLNASREVLGDAATAVQHCDIKPANILLVGDSISICDFGVSRVLGDSGISTTATGMVGSAAYMSPECIERKPSFASDQYSLAISYYELRTGKLPFRDESFAAVISDHVNGTCDFSGVTPAEAEVLRVATSVDPSKRYSTVQEMVRALRQAHAGDSTPPSPSSKWLKGATAIIVACAGIAAVTFFRYPPKKSETLTIQIQPKPTTELAIRIDGEVARVGADGNVKFPRPDGETVSIEVDGSDEFRPYSRNVSISSIASMSFVIQREPRPLLQPEVVLPPEIHVVDIPGGEEIVNFQFVDGQGLLIMGGVRGGVFSCSINQIHEPLRADEMLRHASRIDDISVGTSRLATVDASGIIRVTELSPDAGNSPLEFDVKAMAKLAMSGDDRWLISSSESDGNHLLRAWDLQNPKGRVFGQLEMVRHLRYLPHQERLVTVSDVGLSGSAFGIWDPRSAEFAQSIALEEIPGAIETMSVSPDGSFAAMGGDGPNSGAQVYRIPLDSPRSLRALPAKHEDVILSVAIGSDGRVASGDDGEIVIQDRETLQEGKETRVVTGQSNIHYLHFVGVGHIVSANRESVKLVEIASGRSIHLSGEIMQVIVSTDGNWLFIRDNSGQVMVVDLSESIANLKRCIDEGLTPPECALPDRDLQGMQEV